jgi:hypothetical protein
LAEPTPRERYSPGGGTRGRIDERGVRAGNRRDFKMIFAENIVDGHRVLPILLRDLYSATRVIDVAMFLFFDDPIGEEIARILATKARADVAVRVLLNVEKTNRADPFGTGEEEMRKR